ncbi:MAG: hypothetical protein IH972_03915 [Candidatus Marinimicrobia bacterium]|nr:hypothetical protein [Candidatus Neomarinimicrobiota bacterium]
MRIALDAMGGDHGPEQTVKGAVDFLREVADRDVGVILVGDRAALETEAARHNYDSRRLEINHAGQLVSLDDQPSRIVKTKPDSSLVRAVQLVKDGAADGIISAGSTGALLTASLMILGRIRGVRRPAIATFMPSESGGFLLCDVGANLDARPTDLVQSALMARAYAIHEMHLENPRIGLMNIGTEAGKGNEITQQAFELRDLIVSVINRTRTLIPSTPEVSLTHKYIKDPAWLRHTICVPESVYRIIQVMVNRMAKNNIYRIIRERQKCRIKLL